MGKKSKEILVTLFLIATIPGITSATQTQSVNDNYQWGGWDAVTWSFQSLGTYNCMASIYKSNRTSYTAWGPYGGYQFYARQALPANHRQAMITEQNCWSPGTLNWIILQVIITNGAYAQGWFEAHPTATCNDFINAAAAADPNGQGQFTDQTGAFKKPDGSAVDTGNPYQTPDAGDNAAAAVAAAGEQAHDDAEDIKDKMDEAADIPERQDPTSEDFRPDPANIETPESISHLDPTAKINKLINCGPPDSTSIDLDLNIGNLTNWSWARISLGLVPEEGSILEQIRTFFFWFLTIIFCAQFGQSIYTTLRQT